MRQERKVVTVLFCDLAGFTAQAEEMDPEDVAALLGPYHARVKEELERFGGTVEKFIGDAVMALFGAPIAHEDDPERAVRAALAIRDYAREEGIELRIGITTGEALVNVEARPEQGETMATGDVVNTAARLQSAAPVGGVLVSERTYEATKQAIEYAEAEPVEAKGKAQPVSVWEATSAAPPQERAHTTPLVGRVQELAQLREALDRVRAEQSPQLVTIVGPPGLGKSRLLYEVSRADGWLTWRRGRCLPYGDGVTFWALGEIVKGHAGIFESDRAEEAEVKLRAAVHDPWVERHLRPLVGLGEPADSSGDRRAEAFAAWRRFLTTLAKERPLALVIEDIHWADDALLDFLTSLVEWAQDATLLLLCTARPELHERRPAWGGMTISLAPLSHRETGRLLAALGRDDAPDELVVRTAGNPLYAEQYARLLTEGGSFEELPGTVQGIIAARLDGLPPEDKALVHGASVVGSVFWSGALARLMGADRWSVEERLLALERRELVRREQSSSVEGEEQYSFRHVLLRDVAYAEIPRADRAVRHRLAAEWIESVGRPEERAEMLAYHYVQALEFARASGQETEDLEPRAWRALRDAGKRASVLSSYGAAARFFDAALQLPAPNPRDRARLLLDAGRARFVSTEEGADLLEQASAAFQGSGDPEGAAEAERFLAELWRLKAEGDLAEAHVTAALALVHGRPPSESTGRVVAFVARYRMVTSAHEEAIRLGTEALSIGDALDLDDVRMEALNALGTARLHRGDMGGRADLERAIDIGTALNAAETVRAFNNLGASFVSLGDLREAAAAWDAGRAFGRRFGDALAIVRFLDLNLINQAYWSGTWVDALNASEALIEDWERGAPHTLVIWAYDVRGRIRLARDDLEGAHADSQRSLDIARRTTEASLLVASLAFGAAAALTCGRLAEASALAEELLAHRPARKPLGRFSHLFDLSVVLCELDRAGDLLEETSQAEVRTRWVEAAEAYAGGNLERAVARYSESGALPLEAFTRLKAAEQLVAEGKRADAEEHLEKALAFWRSVGATRYIRQCEELLRGSA
ncbi:MAG TPA: adenylate/guanylate cyclase domain-containing protein [Gaiellaceae bacterium]|nr:adenylate/guanylate cyclase domain-containing protein [Gaiellaceae bacterium]